VGVAVGVAVLTHLLSTSSSKAAPNYINLEQLDCMAKNIYFEARNEATVGQLAVAQTVINRVESTRFPNTICGVVQQGLHSKSGFPLRDRCHFSWYCDGYHDEPKKASRSWARSVELAQIMIINKNWMIDVIDGATHYHADYVDPKWNRKKRMVVRIGSHLFYR
jgi:spore germination cell wall hydrolase CwlJ-like protein|tara:strand:+ start:392 stop:883 length:492 start_codon:yes stop_codon:yes gene_type:complete